MQTGSIKNRGRKSYCAFSCLSREMKHQDLNSKTCNLLNLAYTGILVCAQAWELAKKCMFHPVAKYSTYTYCTRWNHHKSLPAISRAQHCLTCFVRRLKTGLGRDSGGKAQNTQPSIKSGEVAYICNPSRHKAQLKEETRESLEAHSPASLAWHVER